MFGLEILAKLIKILRSGATPAQIAGGFILGMILGLTPFFSLHNLIVVLLVIIFNVNIGIVLFSFAIFSGIAYLFDPLFHDFGYYLLTGIPSFKELWVYMYNTPILALSKFNNTVVMGSLVSSLLLLLPGYIFAKKFVVVYRSNLEPRIAKLRIVQIVQGSKAYGFYEKARDWRF